MKKFIAWISNNKLLSVVLGVIGILSSGIGIWQFLVLPVYPTVTLGIDRLPQGDAQKIEVTELSFLGDFYRYWPNDERFVIDLRLGDFRETLPEDEVTEMHLRVFDSSSPHLSRKLNFLSVFVDRGCHDQAITFETQDSCDQVAIYFEKPATTLDYSPNVGEDHPISKIVDWDGPQWLTFVFDARYLTFESSEFNLRIYGYGKFVRGSGGMGEHHYNFVTQPYDADKLARSID